MQKAKKAMVVLIILGIAVGAIALVVKRSQRISAIPHASPSPTPVRIAKVEQGSLSHGHSYLAKVEPYRVSNTASQLSVQISKVLVDEGDRVREGQVIILLEDRDLRSELEQAQAQLKEANEQAAALQATLESQNKTLLFWQQEANSDLYLAQEGAIARRQADKTIESLNETKGRVTSTEHNLTAITSQVKAAEEKLVQARIRFSYTSVTAPFDGVVRKRLVDSGDFATPGKVLAEIEDDQSFKLVFTVPQEEVSSLKVGQKVHIGETKTGSDVRISRIHPSLNQDRTLTAEIDIPSEMSIRSGSYLPVKVIHNEWTNVMLLHQDCLVPMEGGKTAVFIIEDGKTKTVPVKHLADDGNMAAIEGLAVGTAVVRMPFLGWNRLSADEVVEVIQ